MLSIQLGSISNFVYTPHWVRIEQDLSTSAPSHLQQLADLLSAGIFFREEDDSFWPFVKSPVWCFYSTPHRRVTQGLGRCLQLRERYVIIVSDGRKDC